MVWRWVHDVPDAPQVDEPIASTPDPAVVGRVFRDRRLRLVAGMLAGRLVDDTGKAAFRPTWR